MAWHPGAGDSLTPPGFRPVAPRRSGSYMDMHPTRYEWEPHVARLVRKLYWEMGGPDEIHVNTYFDHPPDDHPREWPVGFFDRLSLDVWGPGGRGDPVGHAKGERAFNLIWNDRGRPYVDWIVWERILLDREAGFVPTPYGRNPFEWHEDHLHLTAKPRLWTP